MVFGLTVPSGYDRFKFSSAIAIKSSSFFFRFGSHPMIGHNLTEHLTIFWPQNLETYELYVVQECRSADIRVPHLWYARSRNTVFGGFGKLWASYSDSDRRAFVRASNNWLHIVTYSYSSKAIQCTECTHQFWIVQITSLPIDYRRCIGNISFVVEAAS